jgi:hypothetical protein
MPYLFFVHKVSTLNMKSTKITVPWDVTPRRKYEIKTGYT